MVILSVPYRGPSESAVVTAITVIVSATIDLSLLAIVDIQETTLAFIAII